MDFKFSYVLSGEGDTYRPDTLAYISGQGVSSGINTVASILGISATAIAGAMAEEADSYYRRSWRVDTLDQYALSAVAVGSDAWQKLWFAIKMGPDSADAWRELSGDAGSDRLEGGNGDDILDGGAGNDTLVGGRGDDTYIFAAGGGQDVIDNSGGGADTLHFEGISFNQVASGLMKSGNDLVLNVGGGSDKVTIRNWFLGGDYVVDTITFASGGQLTAAQLFGAFGLSNPDPVGSPAYQNLPDERAFGTVLAGQSGDQRVLGSSDDDMIDGGAGNDILRGNTGSDYLIGGAGSDTYMFALGDGQDVINNLSNTPDTDTDVLSIEDIAREDLWLSRNGSDLVIDVSGS